MKAFVTINGVATAFFLHFGMRGRSFSSSSAASPVRTTRKLMSDLPAM